jgi:uncharacterized protein
MRKVLITLLWLGLAITPVEILAQEHPMQGTWSGKVTVEGQIMGLVLHLEQQVNIWKGTIDSPDQDVYGIPVDKVLVKGDTLLFEIASIQFKYLGVYNATYNIISGALSQYGYNFELNFEKKSLELERPQTPKPPFTYRQEEVVFENEAAGIKLAGTLTLPEGKGPFPAVVLITGSGPQNRDEEIFQHKPFLLWAHELTQAGFAVLRYDDRGFGASEGNFQTATTRDFATDAQAAIDFLKKRKGISKKDISVLGHSEGAMIAVMLAGKKKNIKNAVLLAGPGISGAELLIDQTVLVSTISQLPPGIVSSDSLFQYNIILAMISNMDSTAKVEEIKRIVAEQYATFGPSQVKRIGSVDQFFDLIYRNYNNPWMMFFLKYDPYLDLTKMNGRVLALFGEKDIQVAPGKSAVSMERALKSAAGVTGFEIKVYPGLNHLFQEAETGLVDEYRSNTQTLSPQVIEDVIRFLKN